MLILNKSWLHGFLSRLHLHSFRKELRNFTCTGGRIKYLCGQLVAFLSPN